MKKSFILLLLIFPLLFSCEKEEDPKLIDDVKNVIIKNVVFIDKGYVNADPAYVKVVHGADYDNLTTVLSSGWQSYKDSIRIELNFQMGDRYDSSLILARLSECDDSEITFDCKRIVNDLRLDWELFDTFFDKEYCIDNDRSRICFRYEYIWK